MNPHIQLSINTHDYDGHLKDYYKTLVSNDNNEYDSFEKVLDLIFADLKNLRSKYPLFKNASNRILSSLKLLDSDRKNNYDPINDIRVEDLLPRVWNKVSNDESIRFVFYEQIIDILEKGSCSQGRVTRLIQFL